MNAPPLVEVRELTVRYLRRGGWLRRAVEVDALRDVSFRMQRGESLAIVGESGSGKSTLARSLLRLHRPAKGQVLLAGLDLAILSPAELRDRRRSIQMVFQDPLASLDPMQTVYEVVAEPLRISGPPLTRSELLDRVSRQLEEVGMGEEYLSRRSQRLSGGQAQRVAIARALICNPAALICDEPVSALDASLRAQILDLLDAQRRKRDLALLFVTHDLAAARYLCERTLVLHRGAIVEQGNTEELFANPGHPYSRTLLQSRLTLD
jgi:ABC-type glutathione transport system ATPase component